MDLSLKQWMHIFEDQASSGLNKQEWCIQNGIKRNAYLQLPKRTSDNDVNELLLSKGLKVMSNVYRKGLTMTLTPVHWMRSMVNKIGG